MSRARIAFDPEGAQFLSERCDRRVCESGVCGGDPVSLFVQKVCVAGLGTLLQPKVAHYYVCREICVRPAVSICVTLYRLGGLEGWWRAETTGIDVIR